MTPEVPREDSPWSIVYQWAGWELERCPGCAGELRRIARHNLELGTDRYSLCVRCRTRRRNAINYRKRSPETRRRAALRARRGRLRRRIARLESELRVVELELGADQRLASTYCERHWRD